MGRNYFALFLLGLIEYFCRNYQRLPLKSKTPFQQHSKHIYANI